MDVTKTNRYLKELLPIAQKAWGVFYDECIKQGVPVFLVEGFRSQARQNYIYEQGRSRGGNIVTWTKSSVHTQRLAFDIAINKPYALYDKNMINKAVVIARKLGLKCGADFGDNVHFEVPSNWKDVREVSNEKVDAYIVAIDKLVAKGVISSPEVWKGIAQANIKVDNVKSLIIKFASKL